MNIADDDIVVICMPDTHRSIFDDDRHGVCMECGIPVHCRPHLPADAKLLCIHCYRDTLADEAEVYVTEKTLQEVLAVLKDADD